MTNYPILRKMGLSEKAIAVYTSVLRLGPSSVRTIAEESGINRGTTYDLLKWLMKEGLVSFYHKEKKQYFIAEDPEKLERVLSDRMNELEEVKTKLVDFIPELKSIYDNAGQKPVVRLYEGEKGVGLILEDVLHTVGVLSDKHYYVYSAANVRKILYGGFSTFTDERIRREIRVQVIAIGEGGELHGLDERKWLGRGAGTSTYMLLYANKTASISLDAHKQLFGILIENDRIAETQKDIFKTLWGLLSAS